MFMSHRVLQHGRLLALPQSMKATATTNDRSQILTLRLHPRPYLTGLVVAAMCVANLPKVGAEPHPAAPASGTQFTGRGWHPMRLTVDTAGLVGRQARIYLR